MVEEEKDEKKAAQGIGTLIIFIALILVAAVAAGVLIQTASTLQSKSLDVGRQTQEKVSTDLEVVQVYAADGRDGYFNGSIDNFSVVVRLSSGSSAIKLSDTLLRLDTPISTQPMTYILGGGASETQYGVTYLINSSQHKDGYISQGDSAELTFTVMNGTDIPESSTLTIRVLTKNGAIRPVQITTPSAMVEYYISLYP
ncbi:MAG: hypothetical protein H6500_00925 [Candidatus Woesearchaeota archaeon]|nr:hypothetical protein [Nanoarchaeota archaeon]USN44395.1 MAG: hypothetical protein H6500_00925 [Candidatus Woesearchaeota archaeon]